MAVFFLFKILYKLRQFFQYFIFQTPYSINEICKNEKLADSSSFYTAPLKTEQVKKLTARLQNFPIVPLANPARQWSEMLFFSFFLLSYFQAGCNKANSVRDRTASKPVAPSSNRPCGFQTRRLCGEYPTRRGLCSLTRLHSL